MGFGFELRDASGNLSMDTESFGLLLADSFIVPWNGTGSTAYPDLAWSSILVPTQTMEIDGAIYSRKLSSFAFLNFTVTRDANNIPTLTWTSGVSGSSGLGTDANDTSNASFTRYTSGVFSCLGTILTFGGEKRPNISIAVFAG